MIERENLKVEFETINSKVIFILNLKLNYNIIY